MRHGRLVLRRGQNRGKSVELTDVTDRAIYRQTDENQILASYGYHTESNELAIEDLKQAAAGVAAGVAAREDVVE